MTHFLQLLVLLALVIIAAKCAGALANRIGQPAVFGEILAGLILGPTVLNVLGWSLFASPAGAGVDEPAALLPALRDLAEIGVVLPMIGGAGVAVAFGSRCTGRAFSSARS